MDTKIKKLKLNEYDLGQTLGTGIIINYYKDHSVEFVYQNTNPQGNLQQ